MSESPAAGPHVLEEFLRSAQQRGERSVALARLVACLAFLAMHLPARAHLLLEFDLKSWLLIPCFLLGIASSLLTLRWTAAGAVTPARMRLSILVDALIVHVSLGAAVAWPHAHYAGLIREPEHVIVYLAVIGAGIRLSERGALAGAAIHGVGLAALLAFDRHNGAKITYSAMEVVFSAVFLVVAAIISYSIAFRTRDLVLRGANAAVLAERARQRLGVYVSEEVASDVMQDGELHLGGASKTAAVLFSDLRGFTRYAEHITPERLVRELNAYLHDMVAEIRAEGGVVDKYIGDAIMAVFGVPKPRPDDALRAIRAAARMRAALARHNEARKAQGLPPLAHGVGVHHGSMVAGNIGTADRMQYTVIGDVVNLASRLESATKESHVDILISRDAATAAQASGAELPPLVVHGTVAVRGRDQPIEVLTLAGPPG